MTERIRSNKNLELSPLRFTGVALACVALLAACGDSGDNDGAGGTSAGGNSTGGNSTAGTAGFGGSTSGAGGVTSTAGTGGQATGGGGASSGGSDGGSTTGGTGNAGSGTGGSGGASTAVVSDDFEAAGDTPDATKWSIFNADQQNNSVELTTERAHSGTRAIKVDVKSAGAMLMTTVGLPPPDGAVYFRTWVSFASGAGTPEAWTNHVTFIESGGLADNGDVDQGDEARIGGMNGKMNANLSQGDGLSPSPWSDPCPLCTSPPANDEWVCIRGYIDVTNQRLEAWMGDTQFVNAAMASDWHSGSTYPASLERIGFGWEAYGAVANTVYYDDIAVGYSPIECE